MCKHLRTVFVRHNSAGIGSNLIINGNFLSVYSPSCRKPSLAYTRQPTLSFLVHKSQQSYQMDQHQSPQPEASKPQILGSSQDPEEPDTKPAEPLITRAPSHSRDVEGPDPTTPAELTAPPPSNDPNEPNDPKEEPNPPEPTLLALIKQTLQTHQHPIRPSLPHDALLARQARINSLTKALNHRSAIRTRGSTFCASALRYVRQISYMLQLIENHMERNGGEAPEELNLREMRGKSSMSWSR